MMEQKKKTTKTTTKAKTTTKTTTKAKTTTKTTTTTTNPFNFKVERIPITALILTR
jgi:hypothetical protein